MISFSVEGMTCGGCARAVANAVRRVDPTAAVEVNLGSRRVAVDSTADRERLRRAIEDAGYKAQPAA